MLAGGLGGSRFARTLAETIDPQELTIVGNVGDDVEVFGLHVSSLRPQPRSSSSRPVSV